MTTPNTTTIDSSSEIALSLIEVYETTADLKEFDGIMGQLRKVYEGVEQTSITQAYGSYPADELPIQVRPVPARHLAHMLIALSNITDGDPAPSNDIVSYVKLENVQGGGEAIFLGIFKFLNRAQKLDYALESDNVAGRVYLDWTDIRNGFLSNIDVDAIKYKILATAPTATKVNALRIYKKFIASPVA